MLSEKQICLTLYLCNAKEHLMSKKVFYTNQEPVRFIKDRLGIKIVQLESWIEDKSSVYLCLRCFVSADFMRKTKIDKLLQ